MVADERCALNYPSVRNPSVTDAGQRHYRDAVILDHDDPLPVVNILREAAEADLGRREPRCRVCRDPDIRSLVDDRLAWRGVPIFLGRGRFHRITLAEIMRDLEPLNEGRDKRRRITYASLWVHANRHYDLAGTPDYRSVRISVKLKDVLAGDGL